jgi:hypothetical protein
MLHIPGLSLLGRLHFGRYLGEWHAHSESMEEIAEMAKTSSGQCYTVACVYGAFMVISMVAYCYHSRKRI